MIYIFTKNYKKMYEQERSESACYRISMFEKFLRSERELKNARATISQQDAAFKKANEILTRRQKQPRDRNGKFIKKEN